MTLTPLKQYNFLSNEMTEVYLFGAGLPQIKKEIPASGRFISLRVVLTMGKVLYDRSDVSCRILFFSLISFYYSLYLRTARTCLNAKVVSIKNATGAAGNYCIIGAGDRGDPWRRLSARIVVRVGFPDTLASSNESTFR